MDSSTAEGHHPILQQPLQMLFAPDLLCLSCTGWNLTKIFTLQLHVEMQQSMQQLSAIQSELRGNINFMNPG